MSKEITLCSAVLGTLRAGRQLRRVQPSPRFESSVNAKSTHRAPTSGKCQLTGALEPLLEGGRTGSEENVNVALPSSHRNLRQPDGAAPDRPRPRSFGCSVPRTRHERVQ